jgi:hypothetical protein
MIKTKDGKAQTKDKGVFFRSRSGKEHNGCFCSVGEALTIAILGSTCGLRNADQIHQLASSQRVSEFTSVHFPINDIPCYCWLLCLLKLTKPDSLNRCFMKRAQSLRPGGGETEAYAISFDGKTIRPTGKVDSYENPPHMLSARLAEP